MPIIKFYAGLRKTAGLKELSRTPSSGMLRSALPGATLGGVLAGLVEQVPALGGVILEDGQIPPHFVITINGRNVTDLNAPVSEQDVIAIFPPIAGG